MDDVRSFIDENAAAFFAALQDWLRIPSISADPARRGDVRRSAQWLADQMRATGFPVAEVWETGDQGPDGTGSGQPAVFAQWPAADPAASRRAAPPVTLKLLVEDEEESGSPHFPALLRREADQLACDVPPGLTATVTSEGDGVRPSFSPLDSAAVRAGQRAMERAFGMDVLAAAGSLTVPR